MKTLRVACVLCAAAAASSLGAIHKIPEDNPVATINAPAGWKANNYDKGIELTSDDGEVYIAIEATDAKSVESSMGEAMEYLKSKGVTVDAKTVKQNERKLSGKEAVTISWDGEDEEGPAKVELMVVSVTNEKGVLFLYWASPEGEKKHEKEIAGIAESLKKA